MLKMNYLISKAQLTTIGASKEEKTQWKCLETENRYIQNSNFHNFKHNAILVMIDRSFKF